MSKCEWDELAESYVKKWHQLTPQEIRREGRLGDLAAAEDEALRRWLVNRALERRGYDQV